jgi:hypothetical protein
MSGKLVSVTTMQSTLYDVELWREYAAQMRALSGSIKDEKTRRRTLEAAAGFEQIAQLASKLGSGGRRSLMGLLSRTHLAN